jgi:hypothetical protein
MLTTATRRTDIGETGYPGTGSAQFPLDATSAPERLSVWNDR